MPRAALLALAVLVAGIACFVWLGGTERTRAARANEAPGPAAPADAPVELRAPAADAPGEAESAGSSHRAALPDERVRIAGRVRVAGGYSPALAARIEAEVYAGRENESRALNLHADVASDGSFELRVPKGTRYAWLYVQGELLYLADPVKALPGASAVLLEPELLAIIHGRVLPPLGEMEVDWSDIGLTCSEAEPEVPPDVGMLSTHPDEGGAFELARMPTGVELELRAKNPFGPAWRQRVDPLLPGERREVVIALDRGITLAGRVVDEHGAPVARLDVNAEQVVSSSAASARFVHDSSESEDAVTDEDGRFEFTGLVRAAWNLRVSDSDLVRGAELAVDGSAGDARDVVLSVVRGGCIAGTVEWPDGRPVAEFSITAVSTGARDLYSADFSSGDFRAGAFEQCGVSDEPHDLEVRAEGDGVHGWAHLSGVRAGDRGLHIVLDEEQVFAVRGTVVDAEQRPVVRFIARASSGTGGTSHTGEDGSFVLAGLTAGEWDIDVKATGLMETRQHVLVGPSTPPLSFVLRAASRIRGTVLDARGRPVARAVVGEEGVLDFRGGFSQERTDAQGRFELAATSSTMKLQAVCSGHAASEPVEFAVESGAILDGVVLRLREPSRLGGRVLDADGRPVGGASVYVRSGRSSEANSHSDARGEFAFEDLPPGKVDLMAWHQDLNARAATELAGGRTTTVELRFQRPDPVLLRGKITRGGQPYAGALWFSSRDLVFSSQAESGADGRFDVTLQHPGDWTCAVWIGQEGAELRPQDVHVLDFVVPDVEQHELELDLDTMRPLESFEELGY